MTADAWLQSLPARHAASMTRSEFLKAIRALSARYVERRGALPDRSPLDSAGKRAAFASFYAPLHFVTTQQIIASVGTPQGVETIIDAGCGTGVAGAAWAITCPQKPSINGIDLNAWALDEARMTWRALELNGRATRGDYLSRLDEFTKPAHRTSISTTGIVFGWSLNELDTATRKRAHGVVTALAARGARVLVLEPISRSLVPWWNEWAESATAKGARADEWRFADALPPFLAELNQEAGFTRTELTARSLAINWTASAG